MKCKYKWLKAQTNNIAKSKKRFDAMNCKCELWENKLNV